MDYQELKDEIRETTSSIWHGIRSHWLRTLLIEIGFLFLGVEQFDLHFSARAQGWFSVVGFIVIIVAGWYLLRRNHLSVLIIALALIPFGLLFFIPILSQLGILIVLVLSVRWLVLKVRGVSTDD